MVFNHEIKGNTLVLKLTGDLIGEDTGSSVLETANGRIRAQSRLRGRQCRRLLRGLCDPVDNGPQLGNAGSAIRAGAQLLADLGDCRGAAFADGLADGG